MKKLLFAVTIFFLLPTLMNAACTDADVVRLQKLAANVKITYDYFDFYSEEYLETRTYFNVTLSNLTNEIYGYENYGGAKFLVDSSKGGFYPEGYTLQINILVRGGECADKNLTQSYVTFPYANPFFEHAECKGIENYELCQKWYTSPLTEDYFLRKVKAYKTTLPNEDETKEKPKSTQEKVVEFIQKYYLFILTPIVLGGSGAIYYIHKENKKKQGLLAEL